jgi:hypothetical protein
MVQSEDNMNKKLILLTTTLCTTFLLFGCNNEKTTGTEIKELEKQIEELKMENEALKGSRQFEEEGIDTYTKAIKTMSKKLSPADQKELYNLLWNYQLTVNGEPIPKDGIIQVDDRKIEVVLSQRDLTIDALPHDPNYSGAISGEYFEHITKIAPEPSDTTMSAGTVVVGSHYIFNDVEQGETISFTITDELKQRLGLDKTTITIKRI